MGGFRKKYIQTFLLVIFTLLFTQFARAAGELSITFENGDEFTIFPQPDGSVHELFPTFCEGNAEDQGGTELVSNFEIITFNEQKLDVFVDIELCDFCECAGLEGQAFEDCRAENEGCVTYRRVRVVADAVPQIFQPDGIAYQTTITENNEPVLCEDVTNKLREKVCDQAGECCNSGDDGNIAPIKLDYRCLTVINPETGLTVRTLAGSFITSILD